MSKTPRKGVRKELADDPARKLRPRRDPRDTGDSVDFARRPGPGDAGDAERPQAPRDAEEQASGRTLEEELRIPTDEDDSGILPHQKLANSGPDTSRRRGVGLARRDA